MAMLVPDIAVTREHVLSDLEQKVDSSSCSSATCLESPILIFSLFHKVIRTEIDSIHCSAVAFAAGELVDIRILSKRYRVLGSIYNHYSNAEDEVIFPALDTHVKNVAQTYFIEHEGERNLFYHLLELMDSNLECNKSFLRELASSSAALRTSINQHMAKEEEQVFPLLAGKFSHEEQASLVWQFLCSIPVNTMGQFLPWFSSTLSSHEYQDMQNFLRNIVPEEKLLQPLIFHLMEGRSGPCTDTSQVQSHIGYSISALNNRLDKVDTCDSWETRRREIPELIIDVSHAIESHPINQIFLWHNAIRRELTFHRKVSVHC